ncbi:hypothetical protein H6P81_014157 [Aristolochia fimbriata]|uniref:Uncharacterized protein n=1 Tax=Aristolochia fimbriata TaxID=158543 RepID=A0AAV7EI95_ARIFI|nr:hypothetical protein H6P81_014157 [Aristolochia fimbriata]
MEAVLICSTTLTPKCLQTRSPLTDSGKNPLRASQSVGFRSPLHLPNSTRRLSIIKNQSEEIKKEPDLEKSTTPGATFARLFTDNSFLTSPKPETIDINPYRAKGPEIKDVGLKLMEAGNMKDAESLLREWCDVYKEQDRLEALLAESMLYQGKYQEVLELPLEKAGPADTRLLLKAVACALLSDRYEGIRAELWRKFKVESADVGRLADSEDLKKLVDLSSPEESSRRLHEFTKKLNDLIEARKEKYKKEKEQEASAKEAKQDQQQKPT